METKKATGICNIAMETKKATDICNIATEMKKTHRYMQYSSGNEKKSQIYAI